MAGIQESDQTAKHQSNSACEIERLSLQIKELQGECEKLRLRLARTEEERDVYLKAVYAYERAKLAELRVEDVDIAALEKASAGRVEMLVDPATIDPIEKFIGAFPSDVPDWANEHDKHLREA